MFNILKKQHRQVVAQLLTLNSATPATSTQAVRFFSQTAEAAKPTPGEAAKPKEEWGEKYSDECFTFEKEWKAISEKIEKE